MVWLLCADGGGGGGAGDGGISTAPRMQIETTRGTGGEQAIVIYG